MEKVQVVLSSYNGEKFIEEQIVSILNQNYSSITLLVRDDGSTDSTKKILDSFNQVNVIKAENIGVVASFFSLLENVNTTAEYVCFADQDDIWLPNKVERALRLLENVNQEIPAMLFTPTILADEDLSPIKQWPSPPTKEPSFYNALYQNIAVGATVTFNRAALHLIRERMPDPDKVLMHDWWLYLCISAFGEVIYDPQPSILYRQHGGNAVGGEVSLLGKLKKKWASFRKHRGSHKLVSQAKEFHRLYGERLKDLDKRQQLEAFIAPRTHIGQRIAYLKNSKLYRQSALENALFRLLILSGYI